MTTETPERRVDPRTGHVWEYTPDEGWRRVTGPEESVTAGQAFGIGAGHGLFSLGRGLQDVGAWAMGEQGAPVRDVLAAEQAEEEALLEPVRERYPLAFGVGAVVPELATGFVGSGIRAARAPAALTRPIAGSRPGSSMAEQVAIGAGVGAMSYEDSLSGRVFNAAAGAVGGGAGFALGTMADRVRRRIIAHARGRSETDIELEGEGGFGGALEGEGELRGIRETPAERFSRAQELRAEEEALLEGFDQPLPTATRDLRVAEAERLGFELTPGMRAGEGPVSRWEAGFESFPPTSGFLTGVRSRNLDRLARNIGSAIGIRAGDLGVENLARAEARIGNKFNEVIGAVDQTGGIDKVPIRDAATRALSELEGLGDDVGGAAVARNLIARIDEIESPTLTGTQTRRMRTALNKRYRDFSRAEGQETSADIVEAIISQVDDSIEQAMPRDLRGTYREAREQWRLLTALRRTNVVRADGTINVRTLGNSLRRTFPFEYARGRGRGGLRRATQKALRSAQVAETIMPAFPDSGTATRLAPQLALDQPATTAALTFGSSFAGDLYARLGGRGSTARAAAALGPVWPAAPTAAGAIGRALAAQLRE